MDKRSMCKLWEKIGMTKKLAGPGTSSEMNGHYMDLKIMDLRYIN